VRAAIVRHGVGIALVAVGASVVIWSALAGTAAPARVLGGDRPVDEGASDPGDLSAHNSPTVVRNPRDRRNLVVTGRVDSPDFSCSVHVSVDGGAHWTRTAVPIPRGAGRKCYAADAVFGRDGSLHVSYATLRGVANAPRAVWVVTSRDGGRTLDTPRRVAGPLAFQARIAADPAAPRRLYVTWLQALDVGNLKFPAPGNPIRVARSDDGGATWQRPVSVNDPRRRRVLAPSAAVGPRGELYVLYLDVRGDRLDYEGAHEGSAGPPYPGHFALVLARSRDGGATWGESIVDDAIVPIERFIPFLPPFPSLAVDRGSGRVYAGFHDGRLGSPDVWVWSLAPGAASWSAPARVNDTSRSDGSWQYLPQLAVAPGGRLDVLYYDRRADRHGVRNSVSLQSSFDAGRTFGPHATLSSRSFDSRIGFGSERGLPTLGSRLGLVSGRSEAYAVWSDTRAGSDASSKQDLVAAEVAPGRPGVAPGTAERLGRGGFALVLGGLAALVLAARRSRRSAR
jgi:hypothetical protein